MDLSRLPLDRFPYPRHPNSRPFAADLPKGQYVFVQAIDGIVWTLPETEGHLHPKILGECQQAIAAGGLLIDEGGVILEIDNYSGSFQFDAGIFPAVLLALQNQGANISHVVENRFDYD